MLDPDYLEQAGDSVAKVYVQIEADMLKYLTGKMLSGDITGQRAMTALVMLSQGEDAKLREILNKYGNKIDKAVRETCEDALKRSDSEDLRRIKIGSGITLSPLPNTAIAATILGIREILERDNIGMSAGAKTAFLDESIWAVTQVNTGHMTPNKAIHEAVRRLNRKGIPIITYRNAETGQVTVRNQVDVAVRRHVRTQIGQDGNRLTDMRMEQAGVSLVEVSSHTGARESHAEWHGRIYSMKGDVTIDGKKYRDFFRYCMAGSLGEIFGGPNCRHSKGPWYPGMKRVYSPDPKHPSGVSNEDIYNLSQQQRAAERDIRATKRDIQAIKDCLPGATGDEKRRLEAELAKQTGALKDQQAHIRKLVSDNDKVLQRSPQREWAGDVS